MNSQRYDSMSGIKRFTWAEVATHNGKGGTTIYIVYKDSVYDVTKYINEHPGGTDSILEVAGQDSTKEFNQAGHSSDAREVMAKYKIGEIVEEEKKFDANGKKKKRVVKAPPETTSRGLCSVITCGLVG